MINPSPNFEPDNHGFWRKFVRDRNAFPVSTALLTGIDLAPAEGEEWRWVTKDEMIWALLVADAKEKKEKENGDG